MKSIFVVLALFAAVLAVPELTEEQKEKVRQYHKECVEETEVDEAKVEMIRKGDFSNNDDDLQRYVLCMMMKAGLMDADGTFHKDVAMSKLPPDADEEKVSRAIDACIDEKGETPQETAFLMVKCYHYENPDHALL